MYLLVTDRTGHWDKVSRPSYPQRMIQVDHGKPKSGTEAIFIKIDNREDRRPEAGWKGRVEAIEPPEKGSGLIYFKPGLTAELEPEEYGKYRGRDAGWYEVPDVSAPGNDGERLLLPHLFTELAGVKDHAQFEDLTYHALRLLGIHRSHQFPRDQQDGKGDGLFRFKNVLVVYDCTLRGEYGRKKWQQIKIYRNQLRTGDLKTPAGDDVETRPDDHRRVWIITKGDSVVSERLGGEEVPVREVTVEDLRRLYMRRLLSSLDEEALEHELSMLGAPR